MPKHADIFRQKHHRAT